jgi:apolipoprotein D and lipocalin family protein
MNRSKSKISVRGIVALVAAFLPIRAMAGSGSRPDLPVVQNVDPVRYLGLWYEIALLPHWFENGCTQTTAQYSAGENGKIAVLNQCLKNGRPHQAKAVAWHAGSGQDGKFKVRFFWPFSGHYWVIALDPDYQWAMVGHPSRKYLWFLSRQPTLPEKTYQTLIQQAAANGYDTSQIERTVH